MHNIKHKRRYTINNLKEILKRNNSTIIKVDKSKAIVIIKKDDSDQKIRAFIKQNNISIMNKDPTDTFQKQIQKTIAQCRGIIDKKKHKYIINMKQSTPQLKAHIKTHKEDMPIRPVVNNINAPSHKIAKLLNQQLHVLLPLTNTYTVKKLN